MEAMEIIKEPRDAPTVEFAADDIVDHIMRIGQFSRLPDDWDSYGSKAVSYEVCEKAAKYLYAAYREISTGRETPVLPFIAPASDGSIVFEWKSNTAELIVVFRANPQVDVEYLTIEKSNGTESEKEGQFNSVTTFVQAVRWYGMNRA